MWPCLAYWAGLCLLIGAAIYALLCGAGNPKTTRPGRASNARVTRPDDPFRDGTWGDDPYVSDQLKISRFHGERNTL